MYTRIHSRTEGIFGFTLDRKLGMIGDYHQHIHHRVYESTLSVLCCQKESKSGIVVLRYPVQVCKWISTVELKKWLTSQAYHRIQGMGFCCIYFRILVHWCGFCRWRLSAVACLMLVWISKVYLGSMCTAVLIG